MKRFTVGSKDVKKLNAYELIGASIKWCLNIDKLTVCDHRAFLEHLYFLSIRAMHDDFKDSAHVEYDSAIRKVAEVEGFAAFTSANNGISVIHYGAQNMRQKKAYGGAHNYGRRSTGNTHEGKRCCFKWNRESGCASTDDKCPYNHRCAKCGSKSHPKHKCNKD